MARGQPLTVTFGSEEKKREVLNHIQLFGVESALSKFKVSHEPMHRWLREVTGDENFGRYPKYSGIGGSNGKTLHQDLVEEFKNCILRMQARMQGRIDRLEEKDKEKDEIIEGLLERLAYYESSESVVAMDEILGVYELCRVTA